MAKYSRYIIISDESVRKGNAYSYFYGGCIIKESEYENISQELTVFKDFLGFHELKRTKITSLNIGNYKKIIDLFFRYVRAGDIKVRIMYSPNNQLSTLPESQDELYPKLYYTFIKRAFSIFFAKENINLTLLMDELPESLSISKKLKNHLVSLFYKESISSQNKIRLLKRNIIEVDSKNHVILQCIDVILGVIEFYLNEGKKQQESIRGKAKLELFQHIYENYIKSLCENFDFDISTGYFNSNKSWKSNYKHFVFKKKKSPN